MSRTPSQLLALVIVALILAGCSDAPSATAASSAGGTAVAPQGQALRFAQCMRDHGVANFPDPDASGALTIETVANGTSIDTNSPAFQQAITACKDLEPAGFTGALRTPEQQQAALKFAQCIRDNGVKDFPDPGLQDPLIDTNRIPSSATSSGMSILHAAMQKCGTFAQAAGVHP
jgi:hypothetical protein